MPTVRRSSALPRLFHRHRLLAWSALAFTVLASCSYGTSVAGHAARPSSRQPTSFATSSSTSAAGRPNIVFVLTDDLSSNLVAQMPQVLGLERTGTSFSHYDVVDSLCCPSRTAIFTGEYPHDSGVFTNGGTDGGYGAYAAHHDEQHSFAVDLKRRGYTTAFMGKYLNGYVTTDPIPPGWDVWDAVGPDGYAEFNYEMNDNGTQVHYGTAPSDYLTDVMSGKASSFISSAANSNGQPFFLEVATFSPHGPFVPARKYLRTAAGARYPKTAAYDAQVKNPPPWLAKRPRLTAGQERAMLHSYQRRVEDDYSVDDLITTIKTALKTAGVTKNTYVIFSSDNGYHMGEYRLLRGKQTAFDTDINVPLVVSGPNVPAGRTVSDLASNIDLASTFDAIAGAPVDAKTDGVSLLPLLEGHTPAKWQQALLVEHHGPNDAAGDPDAQTYSEADPPSYQAVRTLHALYVVYSSGFEEYYNTDVDPNELDNLGGRRAPRYLKRALYLLTNCHRAVACQRAATAPFTSATP